MKRAVKALGWFCATLTCAAFASGATCLAETVCRDLDDYTVSERVESLGDQWFDEFEFGDLFGGD